MRHHDVDIPTPLTFVVAEIDHDAMRTDGERVQDGWEGTPLLIWAVGRDEVAGLMRRVAIEPDWPMLERQEDLGFRCPAVLATNSSVGIRDPR